MKELILVAIGAAGMWYYAQGQQPQAHAGGGEQVAAVEPQPRNTTIIVAPDSARYEPRYQAMPDEKDMLRFQYIEAHNSYRIVP